MDNYSEYLRDLVTQDRIKKMDPAYWDAQIKSFEQKIQEFKDNKKQSLKAETINQKEINKILEWHVVQYQKNAISRSEEQRIRFCKNTILKQITPFGYRGTPEEIDDLLLNWPNNGGEE